MTKAETYTTDVSDLQGKYRAMVFLVLAETFMLAFLLLGAWGYSVAEENMEKEAVRQGYGEYVDDLSDGRRFVWTCQEGR